MTGDLIFILLALLTIVPAIWVVFSPNIVHAGFALLFTLLGAAGLYAYLGADFIAITQLMVYVGGVLVLVLFTVMMTRVPHGEKRRRGLDRFVPAGVFAALIFAVLYKVITAVNWNGSFQAPEATVAEIGTNLMTNYIFPFEYVSLVLLAAMMGAAILIRESKTRDEHPDEVAETPVAETPAAETEVQS
ncbi:MAG: NADH-quinone oxidoreductase subunit J [Candidatus Krumholzibacteria bacterium]|nr:NADH-quinone oxidoreductase subunit J [Candidatus Krumholzibacteria bacterium]